MLGWFWLFCKRENFDKILLEFTQFQNDNFELSVLKPGGVRRDEMLKKPKIAQYYLYFE